MTINQFFKGTIRWVSVMATLVWLASTEPVSGQDLPGALKAAAAFDILGDQAQPIYRIQRQ